MQISVLGDVHTKLAPLILVLNRSFLIRTQLSTIWFNLIILCSRRHSMVARTFEDRLMHRYYAPKGPKEGPCKLKAVWWILTRLIGVFFGLAEGKKTSFDDPRFRLGKFQPHPIASLAFRWARTFPGAAGECNQTVSWVQHYISLCRASIAGRILATTKIQSVFTGPEGQKVKRLSSSVPCNFFVHSRSASDSSIRCRRRE